MYLKSIQSMKYNLKFAFIIHITYQMDMVTFLSPTCMDLVNISRPINYKKKIFNIGKNL